MVKKKNLSTFQEKFELLTEELRLCLEELKTVSISLNSVEFNDGVMNQEKINVYTLALHRMGLISNRLRTLANTGNEGK